MIVVTGALRYNDIQRLMSIVHLVEKVQHARKYRHGLSLSISEAQTVHQLLIQPQEGIPMTDTPPIPPTQEMIVDFIAQVQIHAANEGISFEEAAEQLTNLFVNMVERPLETEIFFLKYRLDQVEPALEVVEGHEARIRHLEEIGGGVVVGPGG